VPKIPGVPHLKDDLRFKVEFERETDGRWIAEVPDLPGVLAYGADRAEAQAKVQALALRVVAERLEHGESGPAPRANNT